MTRARIRLRRRLLALSAVPAVVATTLAVKLVSVGVVGDSAQEHYAAGDIGALRDDVSLLEIFNVVEPATAQSAAGALAVLEGRLDDADTQFSAALANTQPAQQCPIRVNLQLVRERQGDIDAWEARIDEARQRYESALATIADAPPDCFAGNSDPDPQRRAVRNDAEARVRAKIGGLGAVVPLAPPPPPPANAPNVSAPPPVSIPDPPSPDEGRLDIGGDPLDALRQILRDAAG